MTECSPIFFASCPKENPLSHAIILLFCDQSEKIRECTLSRGRHPRRPGRCRGGGGGSRGALCRPGSSGASADGAVPAAPGRGAEEPVAGVLKASPHTDRFFLGSMAQLNPGSAIPASCQQADPDRMRTL